MTARERAELLVPVEWIGPHEERVRRIETAIRSAEDEILEKAAKAVERGLSFHAYAGSTAGAMIRALKSGG